MLAPYFKALSVADLLDPTQASWSRIRHERVPLSGTPVSLQPTAYIRSKWENQQPGKVTEVEVKAMHNGQTLAFHLHWRVPERDLQSTSPGDFPDAAAVALDTSGEPSFHTMGKKGSPLNIWHWQANAMNNGRHVTATGIGTTESHADDVVKATGLQSRDGWQVVIAHDLKVSGQDEPKGLKVGDEITFAVAIWDGNGEERGGLKAFSPDPLTLNISDKRG